MAKGQLAPTITISRPNITSNEITFNLNCEKPWHLDDNPEDNSYTYMVPNINMPIIESRDWAWTIISAIVLLAIAKLLGFLEIKPNKQKQSNTRRIERVENAPEIKFIQNNTSEEEEEEEESIHIEDNKEEQEDSMIDEVVREEIIEVKEIEEDESVIEEDEPENVDDIDAKINKMMSRKRYYD